MKNYFQLNMASFFATNHPDKYAHLKNIIYPFLQEEQVRTLLEKKLGEKFFKLEETLQRYSDVEHHIGLLRGQADAHFKEGNYKRSEKILNHDLKKIASKLAPINLPIIQTWYLVTHQTDLRDVTIPREQVIHHDKAVYRGRGLGDRVNGGQLAGQERPDLENV